MTKSQLSAWLLFFSIGLPAAVEGAEITLTLTGTSFMGGPAFELLLDDAVIGNGVVDTGPNNDQHQTFSFSVPDQDLAAAKQLGLRLTNDKFERGKGDRNLAIVEARVGDTTLLLSNFSILRSGEDNGANNGLLMQNTDFATARLPSFTSFTAGRDDPSMVSVTDMDDNCGAKMLLKGFVRSSGRLTPQQSQQVEAFLDGSKAEDCVVSITGYSSIDGDADANRRLSYTRASEVAKIIHANKKERLVAQVEGHGETGAFGPTLEDNRLVLIEFHAPDE